MLVPGVERNGEQRAGLPLERHFSSGVVPHRRRSPSVEDEDHFLEQLALRSEFPTGCDLADVTIVRRAGGVVVQEDAVPAAPGPRPELDRVQVRDVERADDLQPLRPHTADGVPQPANSSPMSGDAASSHGCFPSICQRQLIQDQ